MTRKGYKKCQIIQNAINSDFSQQENKHLIKHIAKKICAKLNKEFNPTMRLIEKECTPVIIKYIKYNEERIIYCLAKLSTTVSGLEALHKFSIENQLEQEIFCDIYGDELEYKTEDSHKDFDKDTIDIEYKDSCYDSHKDLCYDDSHKDSCYDDSHKDSYKEIGQNIDKNSISTQKYSYTNQIIIPCGSPVLVNSVFDSYGRQVPAIFYDISSDSYQIYCYPVNYIENFNGYYYISNYCNQY